MCSYVNADFDKINFNDQENKFFLQYTWTQEQETDFIKWMIDYLRHNKDARKELMQWPSTKMGILRKIANEFVFNYGWITK